MSKNQYKPYPVISAQHIVISWTFSDRNNVIYVKENEILKTAEGKEFDYENNNLVIHCYLKIERLSELFKKAEVNKSVTSSDGRLGLAVRCFSGTSKQKFLSEPLYFDKNGKHEQNIELEISSNNLRGSIWCELICFFAGLLTNEKMSGNITKNKDIFANIIGSIVYQSAPEIIRIDGGGSIFPVYYVGENDQPLWWVDFNIIDPREDTIEEEAVVLRINRAHPDFKEISNNGYEVSSEAFLKQIYVSLFFQLLVYLRSDDDWWAYVLDNKGKDNTVCALANYGFKYLWGDIDPVKCPGELYSKLQSRMR